MAEFVWILILVSDSPLLLSTKVIFRILAVSFLIFIAFIVWIFPKPEFLFDAREYKIEELSSLFPEFRFRHLFQFELIFLPNFLLTLEFEQGSTEHFKDKQKEYENEQSSASVPETNVEASIVLLIVKVYERDSEEQEGNATFVNDLDDVR